MVSMKSSVFWDVAPCSLVKLCHCFGDRLFFSNVDEHPRRQYSSFLNWIDFIHDDVSKGLIDAM
jgi:hypothetical protein